LRKELTWLFNSTERKPLHAGIAYRNLDNTSASNTIFRWWRGWPWSRRSLRRYILWLHIFNTLPMWASKRSVSHSVIPISRCNLLNFTDWNWIDAQPWIRSPEYYFFSFKDINNHSILCCPLFDMTEFLCEANIRVIGNKQVGIISILY